MAPRDAPHAGERTTWKACRRRSCTCSGCTSATGASSAHPRGVFKLRISLDARYPGIAEECERAIRAVMPNNRVGKVGYGTWHELYAYSKSWPCLFPQHGPGPKQTREIELTEWQRGHVARWPAFLLAWAHSLGWLSVPEHRAELVTPPIFVREQPDGIKEIFCDACDLMGLH